MKLICGLGNPGPKYLFSRHNIGFIFVDSIAATMGLAWKKHGHSLICELPATSGGKVLLAKPQTFMNRSGQAARELILYFKLEIKDLVVIHDDVDLEFGVVRLKRGGGHGGNNGMRDLITSIGTPDFDRIKIGVGRPANPSADLADYVLSSFAANELDRIKAEIFVAVRSRLREIWGQDFEI